MGLTYAQARRAQPERHHLHGATRARPSASSAARAAARSSLVSLIPRFYDATDGQRGDLFGHPVQDYPREQLRGKVSVVMQKAQLFGGTIRSNLLWGNQNATDADLWAALETAQAAEFVRVEAPWAGRARGAGRPQPVRRPAAAPDHRPRAGAASREILILDDSASALDYATDAALRKALARPARRA